jgi:hypothetical protein
MASSFQNIICMATRDDIVIHLAVTRTKEMLAPVKFQKVSLSKNIEIKDQL